jgi:hypothetical protein
MTYLKKVYYPKYAKNSQNNKKKNLNF